MTPWVDRVARMALKKFAVLQISLFDTTMSERYRKLARAQPPVCGVDTHRAETETCCHWNYTHPTWRRVTTKEPFSEAEVRRIFPDAEPCPSQPLSAQSSGSRMATL